MAVVKGKPSKTSPSVANLTLRVDRRLLARFKQIAAAEHRSLNGELVRLVEERVAEFDAARSLAG